MVRKIIGCLFTLSLVSGCMPYQNSSSCPMVDQYGKCLSVEKAYKEAITGESQGDPMVPKSHQRGRDCCKKKKAVETELTDAQFQALSFEDYRARSYQALKQQLQNPHQPLLLQPKTVRTLVLPYTNNAAKTRFFMSRFVYTIVQDAQWIGDQNLSAQSPEHSGLTDSRKLSK